MSDATADVATVLARYLTERALDPRPVLVLVIALASVPFPGPESGAELQDSVPTHYYPH